MRTEFITSIDNIKTLKSKLIEWAYPNENVIWLDSNLHQSKYSSFEALLFVGSEETLKCNTNAFDQLSRKISETKDYWCGYLTYDLKNELENLSSKNTDFSAFDALSFFRPKKVITIRKETLHFSYLSQYEDEIQKDLNNILSQKENITPVASEHLTIKAEMSKNNYLDKCRSILNHIHKGELYEVNFCQSFTSQTQTFNSLAAYKKLNAISEAPFASLMKLDNQHLVSSSPERYLKKLGNRIVSQPIKGTAKRAKKAAEDRKLKEQLKNNTKERAENIMIVDLVRNDLSKCAVKGSVKVEELCEIYSFEQVHQMISTISATANCNNPVEIIKETFPMGSMTGAPKVAAMEIIETYENSKRGLYSGAVGYFTPDLDFDFNVVIRSIIYNSKTNCLSLSVGSAITAKANPLAEYEECLIKAKALFEVLGIENV